MSIETVNETFSAMTEGLELGPTCEPHESEGVDHYADRLFELECTACGWEATVLACDSVYYKIVAKKDNDSVLSCDACDTFFKPFDLIKSTRGIK